MTPASARTRVRAGSRPALLVAAVAAVVLGILGMHGIDAHGVSMHAATTSGESMTAAPATAAMATHGGDTRSASHATSDSDSHGDSHGASGMLMLCGAMLAAVGATLLARHLRRGLRPKVWAVLQLAETIWRPEPRVRHRGTGPPSAWRFSVIRC